MSRPRSTNHQVCTYLVHKASPALLCQSTPWRVVLLAAKIEGEAVMKAGRSLVPDAVDLLVNLNTCFWVRFNEGAFDESGQVGMRVTNGIFLKAAIRIGVFWPGTMPPV